MKIKIYEYQNCSTCRKALQFLDRKKITYEKFPIVEKPPTLAELKRMLASLKTQGHSLQKLFNTSGVQYRQLKISDQLKKGMTEEEALKLLAKNGKLIKRPFVLTDDLGIVGFQEDIWKKIFS